ncbi:hypothetical protein AKJ16_DCAP16475 [Drosera capensis]
MGISCSPATSPIRHISQGIFLVAAAGFLNILFNRKLIESCSTFGRHKRIKCRKFWFIRAECKILKSEASLNWGANDAPWPIIQTNSVTCSTDLQMDDG